MNRPTHRAVLAAALAFGPVPAALACSANPYVGQVCTVAQDWCPAGTMPADGRLLPIADHVFLYSLIGTIYGGNGTTNFALPDLRGRVIVHRGQGAGLPPVDLGDAFGGDSVPLGVANLPPHTHKATSEASVTATLRGQRAMGTRQDPGGNVLAVFQTTPAPPKGSGEPVTRTDAYSNQAANVDMRRSTIAGKAEVTTTIGPTGGGTPLDNAQPTLVLLQCIAVTGQLPQYPPASAEPAQPLAAAAAAGSP